MHDGLVLVTHHFSVIMNLSNKIITEEENPTLANKTTNWVNYLHNREHRIRLNISSKTMGKLDQGTKKLNADIQQVIWKNTKTA